ncbi:MAG: UDP-N-acetylmuramoyl-L-alanyl-D-glutamate--2,6-diaminopimelate ligase [Deltaproteobacteria bacterium]|nr:UDP-N-acetylmuramoyl-L-alanyl-D-glutamate--2,6-diaminopimelate ligase [Deltaproteobacteria bacterium]
MTTMNLDQVLIGCAEVPAGVEVTGLSVDTRTLKKGNVFFAIEGSAFDGKAFAVEAQKGGASAVVCQSELNQNLSVPVIQVENVREVYAKASAAFFNHPSKDLFVCGVTGTNGKTTITYFLEALWGKEQSGVFGTVNYRCKEFELAASHTTPDAFRLQGLLADMLKHGVKNIAMETSSHALEQCRVHAIDFDAAIFTNLSQDHLDYHKDLDDYYEAKRLLFARELLLSKKQNKVAVINADDEYGQKLIQDLKNTNISCLSYSTKQKTADLAVENVVINLQGVKADLLYQGQKASIQLSLIGEHNLANALAALGVYLKSGGTLERAAKILSQVSVPGRLEKIADQAIFVDYAHTPDALENVLSALRITMGEQIEPGRLITVFGCGGDRDRTKRPLMGRVVAKLSDVALVTSDNPRTEDPEQILKDIEPGVSQHMDSYDGFRGYQIEPDRAKAIRLAIELKKPEDVVLIAGKGHEDYQILGTEKIHFDDREVAREALL